MSGELMRREPRTIVGRTRDEVQLQLQLLAERQRLDVRQPPTWRWLDDGRPAAMVVVFVDATPTPARPAPAPTSPAPPLYPGVRAVLAAVGAAVVLAATGYLIFTLVATALMSALKAAAGLAIGAAVLAPVWWLLSRAGVCVGLHCPGCRHH